ncbi:hypothetical protein KBI23_14780 [bacterium]|nr:hypothetical protein [bacterium]MBP9808026.1 hypothetical protein [bacterium]
MATDSIETKDYGRQSESDSREASILLLADSHTDNVPGRPTKTADAGAADTANYHQNSRIEISDIYETQEKEKHDNLLSKLPDLASRAAAEGVSDITVMSNIWSSQTGVAPKLNPEAQRVFDAIKAQGFLPVLEAKEDPNSYKRLDASYYYSNGEKISVPEEYSLKAAWDKDHRPDLSKIVEDSLAEQQAERKSNEQQKLDNFIANLPELAKQASAQGKDSVYIFHLADTKEHEAPPELNAEQQKTAEAIEAQGFKPVVENVFPKSDISRWFLVAKWDEELSNQCSKSDAVQTASALDENNLSAASEKLQNCGFDGTGLLVDQPRFQKFAEKVSTLENKGTGLDIELHYTIGTGKAFVLNDLEIK